MEIHFNSWQALTIVHNAADIAMCDVLLCMLVAAQFRRIHQYVDALRQGQHCYYFTFSVRPSRQTNAQNIMQMSIGYNARGLIERPVYRCDTVIVGLRYIGLFAV